MRTRRSRTLGGVLQGLGIGVGVMYLLDPGAGRRRRAVARDRTPALLRDLSETLVRSVRDAGNRLYGLAAEARGLLGDAAVSDRQLVARVRARLGRAASRPRAIRVVAHGRRVVLSGDVLAAELTDVLEAVASVRGVREVVNRLVAHTSSADVPRLQGPEEDLERDRPEAGWAPGTRLVAGALGGLLLARGLRRPTFGNVIVGGLGFGLLARAAAPGRPGVDGRAGVDIEKSITIQAPVEAVYAQWTAYETFPYFMRHVREVRDLGNGRSLWTVSGPLDAAIRFQARVTEQQPDRLFAWQTEEGERVAHAGRVQFEALPGGRTRVHVWMTYRPPAGTAGHLVAALFGADPGREMDEDLLRMKSFLETGQPPRGAAQRLES